MAFVKLDCALLDSSVWFDANLSRLFITCLLLAKPGELQESTPSIELDSTDVCNAFTVPPGRYGMIEATAPAIIRRAMMDTDPTAMESFRKLLLPDAMSRTPSHEGRRLARVPGGFVVLNYDDYRSKDHTAADRQRRFRQKAKA